jgi:hypothetical protein
MIYTVNIFIFGKNKLNIKCNVSINDNIIYIDTITKTKFKFIIILKILKVSKINKT